MHMIISVYATTFTLTNTPSFELTSERLVDGFIPLISCTTLGNHNSM